MNKTKLPQAVKVVSTALGDLILFFLDEKEANVYMEQQLLSSVARDTANHVTGRRMGFTGGRENPYRNEGWVDVSPEFLDKLKQHVAHPDNTERPYLLAEPRIFQQLQADLAKYEEFDSLQRDSGTAKPHKRV